MIGPIEHFLREHAAFSLFSSIALGYLVGRIPIAGIRLGGICGTVLVALVIGQSGVQVAPGAAGLSFSLFVYSLGYLGGPAFLSSLGRKTAALIVFPVLQFILALAITIAAASAFHLSLPTSVGLMTGASSQSAALGAASESLPGSDVSALTTSFAVAYLVSILTTVVFVSQILPRFLHVTPGGTPDEDEPTTILPPDVIGRAFVVTGRTGLQLDALRATLGKRIVVAGVLRKPIDPAPDAHPAGPDEVSDGDVIRLIGNRALLATASAHIGPEVALPAQFAVPTRSVEVIVSRLSPQFETLGDVRVNPVVVLGIRRLNRSLPLGDEIELRAGDILSLAGSTDDLRAYAEQLGTIRDPRSTTDFAFLGAGLAIGIAIGLSSVHIAAASISLGTSAAVLITGLFIGWLNSRRHTFGQYDPAAAEVVKDLGLAIFIAATSLTAAPGALQFFRRYGVVVPLVAAVTVLAAGLLSLVICQRLRFTPLRSLGVLAGQQSSSPTMSALQQRFPSAEPLLSYVPIYATSTILSPVLMPAVIRLITAVSG